MLAKVARPSIKLEGCITGPSTSINLAGAFSLDSTCAITTRSLSTAFAARNQGYDVFSSPDLLCAGFVYIGGPLGDRSSPYA